MNAQYDHAPESKSNQNRITKNEQGLVMPSTVLVHPQLEITTPGDSDEQEADEMADSIIQGGKIARSVSPGHSGGGIALPSKFGSQLASLQGQGSRLYGDLKRQMETGFGRDFSDVRIHTGSAAAAMSEGISARAFTYGNDIFFNQGQYSPGTTAGQHLIAHELTHVVQGTGKVSRQAQPEMSSAEKTKKLVNVRINEAKVLALGMIDKSVAVLDLIAGQKGKKNTNNNQRDFVGLFYWCFGGYHEYYFDETGKAQQKLDASIASVRMKYETIKSVLANGDVFKDKGRRKLPETKLEFVSYDKLSWSKYADELRKKKRLIDGADDSDMGGLSTNYNDVTKGEVDPDDNRIDINEEQFKLSSTTEYKQENKLLLAGTIIHELSHRVCGTEDNIKFKVDQAYLGNEKKGVSIDKLINNAYSYTAFATFVEQSIYPALKNKSDSGENEPDRKWYRLPREITKATFPEKLDKKDLTFFKK